MVEKLKADTRGPYKDIKWFCEDLTVRDAKDPCPEPLTGVQHARYKDEVASLAKNKHIYLDQILTGTENVDFWDEDKQNSRIKQYQITNFLFNADNGWILQKAQNYRGAKQIEDEQAWGQEFLEWVAQSDARVKENYLLLRMAAEDIPHGEDNQTSQRVRAYSKLLADEVPDFMNLRIKIHNNPSSEDIAAVKNWSNTTKAKISTVAQDYLTKLEADMQDLYAPFDVANIVKYSKYLPKESRIKNQLDIFVSNSADSPPVLRAMGICELLKDLRVQILETKKPESRIKLIDLTNHLEEQLLQDLVHYKATTLPEIRDKFCFLTDALLGAGYLEQWEYDKVKTDLDWLHGAAVSLDDLDDYKYAVQKLVLWSTQMIQSLYAEPISTFRTFEPLVEGFTDDKIRSSIILPVGQLVEQFNGLFNEASKSKSEVMGRKGSSALQGLNPGFAKGKLVVITEMAEEMDLDAKKIYAFDRPPADLKPVAGILNVKEGNPVSHVQLLARNLAIPNALITSDVLSTLRQYNGEEVFYAVSPKGTVVLKLADDMTSAESRLFSSGRGKMDMVKISTDKIVLDPDRLLDMAKIDATYSGKWCGPKAANLGQLKQLFPEHVVEGFVIPFGVFKDHMQQKIPGVGESYWEYLKRIFSNEKEMKMAGADPKEVECITLQELEILRTYIEKIPLKSVFVSNIESKFRKVLGQPIGNIPVFLRSDTNMEDLPQFTGAGLNLTLFNVLDRQEILNGIKKVWASPYTDRSYQWRQQYLENPEEVYPSILIIPSVNVDKSGVIITKGVSRGGEGDISISFSRGVGGAVEGQAAESYVIYEKGYRELINPGRETKYRVIPASGGSKYAHADFTSPVLSSADLSALQDMSIQISNKMDKVTNGHGPYDIELGIKDDKIWLFQVRPFVENKSATGSDYLQSLDPVYENIKLKLDEK